MGESEQSSRGDGREAGQRRKGCLNTFLIALAVFIAIVAPVVLVGTVYPAFQVFLPSDTRILTPGLRLIATLLMAVIDYGLAYIPLYFSSKRNKLWFNVICYLLTLMWCCFWGVIWYLDI